MNENVHREWLRAGAPHVFREGRGEKGGALFSQSYDEKPGKDGNNLSAQEF